MTKRGLLNRVSALTLGLTFAAASTIFVARISAQQAPDRRDPQTSSDSPAPAGHTYWNMKDYGVVLDVWKCPESGVCLRVQSVDPSNEKLRKLMANKILKKKPEEVTDADMQRLVGFQPQLSVKRENGGDGGTGLGKWKGRVTIAWEKLTGKDQPDHGVYGIEIDDRSNKDNPEKDGETLNIRGFWLKPWPLSAIVSGNADLTPATSPAIRIAGDPRPVSP